MVQRIAVYFTKEDFKKIKKEKVMRGDKTLSKVAKNLIKDKYVNIKDFSHKIEYNLESKETKRYDLNISDELNEKFEIKMSELNHINKTNVIAFLFKKYYLGE